MSGRVAGPVAAGDVGTPVVNTHVHVPPNFSAFDTPEDAVATAAREGIAVLGTSNFHDLRVYARVAAAAEADGILPLHGIEIIASDEDLRREGILVNDPANPGRFYLCGKGLDPFAEPTAEDAALRGRARAADDARARTMTALLAAVFAEARLETSLTDEIIASDVAARADVPHAWVVLQERHLAMAFQEALFRAADRDARGAVLARAFGAAPASDPQDAAAVQGEIRSRLMKAGRPAFVEETPLSFADAYRIVLGYGGIPCYPTLADGASPICAWETPASAVAERVLARGAFVAELIPIRNRTGVVDEYVAAYRDAGILVMAGTEHNTLARIPMAPHCVDASTPSPATQAVFIEATRVVAAHQHLRASGLTGYVDGEGRLATGFPDGESRIRWFAELGADLIRDRMVEASR
jgi:hypothetical protein